MDDPAKIAQAQKCALLGPIWWAIAGQSTKDAEIPQDQIEPINKALEKQVAKAVTPFLLQWIFELTDGRSLDSNIALVLNNARLAAEIACAGE